MTDILQQLGHLGLIPVVAIENAEDAPKLGQALLAGGLPCAEITFRTAAAEQAIRLIATKCPDVLVGAGTVLSVEQAQRAVAAGAVPEEDRDVVRGQVGDREVEPPVPVQVAHRHRGRSVAGAGARRGRESAGAVA